MKSIYWCIYFKMYIRLLSNELLLHYRCIYWRIDMRSLRVEFELFLNKFHKFRRYIDTKYVGDMIDDLFIIKDNFLPEKYSIVSDKTSGGSLWICHWDNNMMKLIGQVWDYDFMNVQVKCEMLMWEVWFYVYFYVWIFMNFPMWVDTMILNYAMRLWCSSLRNKKFQLT